MSQKSQNSKPPRLGEWLLKSFCSYDYLNTALWDMEEIFHKNIQARGKSIARILYVKEALGVVYHLYFKGKSQYSSNRFAMVKNNLIVSLRSLKKNRGNAFVNILGLSSALVIFLLTVAYTSYEFSYDSYHKGADNIYRVYKSVNFIDDPNYLDAGTPAPLSGALTAEFPSITSAARLLRYRKILMETETESFIEPLVYPADPSIFNVFSFEAISGRLQDFINEPFTVAISESVAKKYFNKTDVVGEVVTFNGQIPMTISGVFKDMPDNSHFKMDVIVHLESVMEAFEQNMSLWGNNPFYTYVRTDPNTDVNALEAQLPQIRTKYANDPLDADGQEYTYFLQPLSKVHFEQTIQGGLGKSANGDRLRTYLLISIIILVMACINYINLATARSIVRMKEVGIRKIIGARRSFLVSQFLMESGLLVFLSLVMATVVSAMLLPSFAEFVERPLDLQFGNLRIWMFLVILWTALTLVSGVYPAFKTARFKPLHALNGGGLPYSKGGLLRNSLVVFQFSISAILIIGAFVLTKQLNYIDSLDTGYVRDNVVILSTNDDAVDDRLSEYMEEIRKVSGVSTVATSWSLPTNVTSNVEANWTGITDAERLPMYMVGVTHDFFELYGIELVEGRFFDKEILSDRRSILLNQKAVKELGWKNPIGREMITESGVKAKVIGVVRDFHMQSLREEIEPLQILLSSNYATLAVKIEADTYETLVKIEEVYESFSPVYPFEYTFLEDIYDRAYMDEIKTAQLSLWITISAIIIACLGLYGLATHRVEYRVKELGVRKVMGAKTLDLLSILSKDFVKLLAIAFIIACPVAYYFMNDWLEAFAYHTSIDVFIFIGTLLLMIVIAGFTVGYRTYRAAVSNPIEALRDE